MKQPASYKKPQEIRVGVIGYGGAYNMGREHLNGMQQAGMSPHAVCEIDPARLKAAAADFPHITLHDSVDSLLRDRTLDLVVLITPHNTHAELALRCLRSGFHVVCEKPLALTTAEVDAMIKAAQTRGLMLSTYHNRHWDGCILEAMRQVHEEKAIGEVVRVVAHMGGYGNPGDWWRSSRSISGGILYDWGVHLLEYALQLVNDEMTEVSGFAHQGFWGPQTRWKDDTNEDEAFAVVRFKRGAWLTLCITQIDARGREGMLEVTGTRGSFVFDLQKWKLFKRENGRTTVIEGACPPSQQERYYQNVADHLVRRTPLVITPEWSRRPIVVLDAARRSAAAGRALAVKDALPAVKRPSARRSAPRSKPRP